jgi:hypothetical protein
MHGGACSALYFPRLLVLPVAMVPRALALKAK